MYTDVSEQPDTFVTWEAAAARLVSVHFQKVVVFSAIEFTSLQPVSQHLLFSHFLLSPYGCF